MKHLDFCRDLLPLKDKIYRLGLRITLNAQEAEDLTQDTLIKVWNKRDEWSEVQNIEAYCMTVCRNLALDVMARKEHENLSLETENTDAYEPSYSPDEQLEHDDRLQRVHRLFNSLPEAQRTALQLSDIENMTTREAAQTMQVSEVNFKVILHRARKAIKAQYEKLENYGL